MIFNPVQTVKRKDLVKSSGEDLGRLDEVHEVHLLEIETIVVRFVVHFGEVDHFAGDVNAGKVAKSETE